MFKSPLNVQSSLGLEIQFLLPENEIKCAKGFPTYCWLYEASTVTSLSRRNNSQVLDLLPGQRNKKKFMNVGFLQTKVKIISSLPKRALRERNASWMVRAGINPADLKGSLT